MEWIWTSAGRCFGYWIDADLWTYHGKHVGRRRGNDIYAPTGRYIGELTENGRLITNRAKTGMTARIFVPAMPRSSKKRLPANEGSPPRVGHQDFPHPDDL